VLTLKGGEKILQVTKCENEVVSIAAETLVNFANCESIYLKIFAREQDLSFAYSIDGQNYINVLENVDARMLSTDVAGGFVGNTIGMYASSNGVETCGQHAVFAEFDYIC
jgi:alpha-N-arabinofuranosidase